MILNRELNFSFRFGRSLC